MTTAHVFIATSLDGFIARSDGDIDWLLRGGPRSDTGCFMGVWLIGPPGDDPRAYCLRNYEIFLPFIDSRNHQSLCGDC